MSDNNRTAQLHDNDNEPREAAPTELYLDAAATGAVSQTVIDAMLPFLTQAYGNPSSVHADGKTAARALAAARTSIASDLGAHPGDVIFTSGGTESDNLAIKGIALASVDAELNSRPFAPRRILMSAVEHPAVSESAQWLSRFFSFEPVTIPVDDKARIDLEALDREAAKGAALACVMMANNEVGTVEPIADVVRICHAHGVPVHVDAVQAAGSIPVDFRGLDCDTMSVSGHKFGAPKGLGALLARSRTPMVPLMSGGGQERGLRSGTENVAGAIAQAVALDEAVSHMRAQGEALARSRDALIAAVLEAAPFAHLTGDPVNRLPGHASFVFPGVAGEALLVDLDARGIEVSSGSACAVGRSEAPTTLLALGYSVPDAKSALRITFRTPLSDADIARIAAALTDSLHALHVSE